jgi:hypothetical protein
MTSPPSGGDLVGRRQLDNRPVIRLPKVVQLVGKAPVHLGQVVSSEDAAKRTPVRARNSASNPSCLSKPRRDAS